MVCSGPDESRGLLGAAKEVGLTEEELAEVKKPPLDAGARAGRSLGSDRPSADPSARWTYAFAMLAGQGRTAS